MCPPSELVCLGLGSNLGNRARNIALAAMRLALTSGVDILRLSGVYQTAPWGVHDQPAFLNMVILARTCLEPVVLLAVAKRLETDLGRQATRRWGPRCVDIDILTYGSARIHTPDLMIPHPRLLVRQFVLVPLADIAPDLTLAPGLTTSDLADPTGPGMERIGPLALALRAEAGM